MKNILPYLTVKSNVNGIDFNHYLQITGGQGDFNAKGYGGEYNFCLFYLQPDIAEQIDCCPYIWCKERSIPCGKGDTIEEAHADFLESLKTHPLINL